MTDHDWQQAYNAGKRDAERGLVGALEGLVDALDHGIMAEPENYVAAIGAARTAIENNR